MTINNIEQALEAINDIQLFLKSLQNIAPEPQLKPKPQPVVEKPTVKNPLLDILESGSWPDAIPSSLICDESLEDDKINRADGILDLMVEESIQESNFLDMGCGEGHMAMQARLSNYANIAVGYDIKQKGDLPWEKDNNGWMLTSDFSKVSEKGPFDVVLIYDVLDHLELDTPEAFFSKIKSVLKPKGTIYVRCHPWCSRHGSHLYQQKNKAFIHLAFTQNELEEMGLEIPKSIKIIHPLGDYRKYFKNSKLEIIHEDITRTPVESFFKNFPEIKKRIVNNWKHSKDPTTQKFPQYQMEQSFVDYVLKFKET